MTHQMLGEAGQRFSRCSAETQRIVARWMRDIAMQPPETWEWRWSLIAEELDALVRENAE